MLACSVCDFQCVSDWIAKTLQIRYTCAQSIVFMWPKRLWKKGFTHSTAFLFICYEHTWICRPDKLGTGVSVQLKCSLNFFSREYSDVKGFMSHLSGHIQEGLTVSCPFDGCNKNFNVKTPFSSHISRNHRGWGVTQIAPVHPSKCSDFWGNTSPDVMDVSDADQSKDVDNDKANKLIVWVVWPTLKPFISGSLLIASAKASVAKTNRLGNSGHTCLLDLFRENGDEICPLVVILALGLWYKVLTQLINTLTKFS